MPQPSDKAPSAAAIAEACRLDGEPDSVAAQRIGVHTMTLSRWKRGEMRPSGQGARGLLAWMRGLVRRGLIDKALIDS